jgi:serine/threonine protein kinase
MTPERWRQITGIFNGAVAIGDSAAREAYLLEACAGDQSLREQIESLLAAHSDSTSTLHDLLQQEISTRTRLAPGTALGRYVVGDLLGAGGMGEVYRARDTRLNRDVALKILPPHLRARPQLLARFEREAHAVAALNHPYICTLHDVGRQGDIDFLIMELVEGETLSVRLSRARLSVDEAVSITRKVAEALASTHAQGIIHRDIKPSNIILTRSGHVKVVDFGLARESVLSRAHDSTKDDQTEPGILVGTPYYMSPEQALGEPLDARTDLFSLGIVLFECLTGQRPFEGATRSEYLQNLLSGAVRSPATFRRDIPAALQSLLTLCLQRDLSTRLDSASRMVAELDRIARESGRPRTRRALSTIAAAVALVGAALWWTSRAPPSRRPTSSFETAQLRRFTTTPGEEYNSRLSPDGMWMSFLASERGELRLHVRHVDSAEPRMVTLPAGELESHLWSPEQSAFACLMRQGSTWTVLIVPTYFGSEIPRQSVPVSGIPRGAKLLAWVGDALFLQVEESGRPPSLRRLALKSGAFERLPGPWDDTLVRGLDVRPDGRQVVWAATAKGTERDDLWVAGIDGGTPTPISDPQDESRKRFPLWKGDEKVVYQSTRGGQVDLWELDLRTRESVRISSDSAIEEPDSVSANGSLSYHVRAAKTALMVWRPDGSFAQISNNALSDFAPHVAAGAGLHLAFQRSQPSPVEGFLQMDTDIFVADMPPSLIGPLAPRKVATGFAPRLSRDGSRLAYLQRSRDQPGRILLMAQPVGASAPVTVSSQVSIPANVSFPVEWIEQTVAWASADDLYFIERDADGPGSHVSHYREGQGTTAVPATRAMGRITDIHAAANGKTIAYLVRTAAQQSDQWKYALCLFDRTTGTVRVIREFGPASPLRLRGWLPGDTAVAIAGALQNDSLHARTYELLAVAVNGSLRRVGAINHVVSLSQMSPASPELYFTRAVEGVGNLHGFSFVTGRMRTLTENPVRDISFGAATSLGRNAVAGVHHERTSDIYFLDTRARSKTR